MGDQQPHPQNNNNQHQQPPLNGNGGNPMNPSPSWYQTSPTVNYFQGPSFNFFFGNPGLYDVNFQVQGMQYQSHNVNNRRMAGYYAPSREQGQSRSRSPHHHPQHSSPIQGTIIRPTDTSPPPPGNTLAYLQPAQRLRRSVSAHDQSEHGILEEESYFSDSAVTRLQ